MIACYLFRYNLYYAYKRSKINKNIHATAVNIVIVSLLIQQLILLFFNLIRGKGSDDNSSFLSARAIFSITMFTIFLGLFMAQVFFHFFKGFSPIQYTYQPMQNNPGLDTTSPIDTDGTPNQDSSNEEQPRQFIGFCNPEDQPTFDLPSRRQIHRRNQRSRHRKQYLPEVLRDDEADVFRPRAVMSSSSLVTSDTATFAHPGVSLDHVRTQQPTSSDSYGATEMTY